MIRQPWLAIIPCLESARIYLHCNTVYSAGWSILKILTRVRQVANSLWKEGFENQSLQGQDLCQQG